MARISAIVVTFNSAETILSCLASLPEGIEVLLVDNASTDRTVELVREHHPHIRLIQNGENLGFGRACNIAAREASGHLLLLNPDAVLSDQAFETIEEVLKSHEDCGAVAPLVLNGGEVELSWGMDIGFLAEWRRRKEQRGTLPPPSPLDGTVAWLSGACMLVRRESWLEVGGFDEGFFLYYEDLDLCTRLRRAGWTLRLIPSARIGHARGKSSMQVPDLVRIWYRESQVRFYRKHLSHFEQLLLRAYLLVSSLCRADGAILKVALRP